MFPPYYMATQQTHLRNSHLYILHFFFRKMSYRHQSATAGDNFHYNTGGSHQSAASHHRNFRRYGPQTDIERRAVLALIAREREAQMQAQASESYMQSDMRADGKLTSFLEIYQLFKKNFPYLDRLSITKGRVK